MDNMQNNLGEFLNNLIEINNDRIEGYEKAITLLPKDENLGLKALFGGYRDQSIKFKSEITPFVVQQGETPTDETRTSGKLFRAWMSIKSAVDPFTSHAILESCERGEDEFVKVYNDAMKESAQLPMDLLVVLQSQASEQFKAHNHIKQLRDTTPR